MTSKIEKTTTVSTDPQKNSHIDMNLDIQFPNVPCFLLEVTIRTSVNSLEHDEVVGSFKYLHLDQQGNTVQSFEGYNPFKEVDLNDEGATVDLINQFYEKKLTCAVKGTILIPKVTG